MSLDHSLLKVQVGDLAALVKRDVQVEHHVGVWAEAFRDWDHPRIDRAVERWTAAQTSGLWEMPSVSAMREADRSEGETAEEAAQRRFGCRCDQDGFVTVHPEEGHRITQLEAMDINGSATRPCWECEPGAFRTWHLMFAGRSWDDLEPSWHQSEMARLAERLRTEVETGLVPVEAQNRTLGRLRLPLIEAHRQQEMPNG